MKQQETFNSILNRLSVCDFHTISFSNKKEVALYIPDSGILMTLMIRPNRLFIRKISEREYFCIEDEDIIHHKPLGKMAVTKLILYDFEKLFDFLYGIGNKQ